MNPPDVSDTPCPGCGEKTLVIEARLAVKPIGDYSLAGAQMKVSAYKEYWLACKSCKIESKGRIE